MASGTTPAVAAAAAALSVLFVVHQAAHRQNHYQKDSHTYDQCSKIHDILIS